MLWRVLFFVALVLTLVAFLLPAPDVLALKAGWFLGYRAGFGWREKT